MNQKLSIIVESIIAGYAFGFWQNSFSAGSFMFFFLITLAMIYID